MEWEQGDHTEPDSSVDLEKHRESITEGLRLQNEVLMDYTKMNARERENKIDDLATVTQRVGNDDTEWKPKERSIESIVDHDAVSKVHSVLLICHSLSSQFWILIDCF